MQLRSLARSWLIVLIVVLALGLAACSQDEESAPAVEADAPAVEATTASEPTLEPTEVPTEVPTEAPTVAPTVRVPNVVARSRSSR